MKQPQQKAHKDAHFLLVMHKYEERKNKSKIYFQDFLHICKPLILKDFFFAFRMGSLLKPA